MCCLINHLLIMQKLCKDKLYFNNVNDDSIMQHFFFLLKKSDNETCIQINLTNYTPNFTLVTKGITSS